MTVSTASLLANRQSSVGTTGAQVPKTPDRTLLDFALSEECPLV